MYRHLTCYSFLLHLDRFLEDSCSERSSPPLARKIHSDEGHPRPQRRERTKFNRVQSLELEREFQKNPYPGIQRRVELACKLAIDESRIQVTAISDIKAIEYYFSQPPSLVIFGNRFQFDFSFALMMFSSCICTGLVC